MNRLELAGAVAKRADLSERDALNVVNALVYEITRTVKRGDPVSIYRFGSFQQTRRAPRMARNPQTGEPVKVRAAKRVKFTPSATLKTDLNPRRAASTVKKTTAKKAAVKKAAGRRA